MRLGRPGRWKHGTHFEAFCSALYERLATREKTTGDKPPGGLYLARYDDMAWGFPWSHEVSLGKRSGGVVQGGDVLWTEGPPLKTKLELEASGVRRIKRKKAHLDQYWSQNYQTCGVVFRSAEAAVTKESSLAKVIEVLYQVPPHIRKALDLSLIHI